MVGFPKNALTPIAAIHAAIISSSAGAGVLLVDDDNCPGPGDGSPRNPYCSIQTAIDNAVDGDEIVVAPGTYSETIDFLGRAVTLRSSDGPRVTTIDARQVGTVVTCGSREGPDTVLEGLTITGGHAFVGGGMSIVSSSPTVSNCTFTANAAVTAEGAGGVGGGMSSFAGSPTVVGCTFVGNSAQADGGAMYVGSGAALVAGCLFEGNTAEEGGGGMFNDNATPVNVIGCTFNGNSANIGGGMYNRERGPIVAGCSFQGNIGGEWGGGLFNRDSVPIVVACRFLENATIGHLTPGAGGGIANFDSAPLVINCLLSGNLSADGAGMRNFEGSAPRLINCTLTQNNRAAMRSTQLSEPIVIGSIVWGNAAQIDDVFTETVVSYSDVEGGWPGTGNIDAVPLFVDPDNGDFRLSPGSPCIDAGYNNAILGVSDTDLDGNPRFADDPQTADIGCGVPAVVDMGAYEFQGAPVTVLFGDLNGDGRVGGMDLGALNQCMGSDDPDCCVADLDLDGEVGTSDALLLIAELIESVRFDLRGR